MKFQAKLTNQVCKNTGSIYVQVAVGQNGILHYVFSGSDAKMALKNAASVGRKLKLGFSSVSDFELI